jgi:Fur family peroxide stress response transcriptional regulator
VRSRIAQLIERCHAAGMNVTPQRLAIYRALLECDDHPRPEALYQRILPHMPTLSLATIYKALEVLEELGVVRAVAVIGDSKRFDANLDQHHHLMCTRCRKVSDLYEENWDRIAPPRNLGGFVAESVSVHVLGTCADCAALAHG